MASTMVTSPRRTPNGWSISLIGPTPASKEESKSRMVSLAGSGGGMYLYDSSSRPTLTNCVFSGNSAGREGGGMYIRFLMSRNPSVALIESTS
ncbi:MAG TPA: hypothetical protein EYQ50_26560 [Verrucomicrobiales bacterium]|nr:hypothetical protein [Verrucomicrobiales bacterium]